MLQWALSTFKLPKEKFAKIGQKELSIKLVDVRTHEPLVINVTKEAATVLLVTISSPEIETASEVLQDLCQGLNKTQVDSTCSFPRLNKHLTNIVESIENNNTMKTHFTANISENILRLKSSIVRAEASLMITDIAGVRTHYA